MHQGLDDLSVDDEFEEIAVRSRVLLGRRLAGTTALVDPPTLPDSIGKGGVDVWTGRTVG